MSYGEFAWLLFKLGGSLIFTGAWLGALWFIWTC